MAKHPLVLDASVAVKWYLRENLTEESYQLKDWIVQTSAPVAVPELFFVEAANVVWKKFALRKELSKIQAQEIFRDVSRLPFHVMPNLEILSAAFRLSLKHSVSVYDGIYLAAAEELGALFVTADSALANRLQDTPLNKVLVPLADWKIRLQYI